MILAGAVVLLSMALAGICYLYWTQRRGRANRRRTNSRRSHRGGRRSHRSDGIRRRRSVKGSSPVQTPDSADLESQPILTISFTEAMESGLMLDPETLTDQRPEVPKPTATSGST